MMITRQWAIAFTLWLAACSLAHGQVVNPDIGTLRPTEYYLSHAIEDLACKLGSSSYAHRERARKTLEAFGPSLALEPLRRMSRTKDAETNRRMDELVRLF